MITAERAIQRPAPIGAPVRRTSDVLRDVLRRNPDLQEFTIGGILQAIGPERTEASLILFSVPAIAPVPDAPHFSPRTATAVGAHFALGRKELRLPDAILNKKVPRRSLAVAIHLVAPVLEFAEKTVRPRLAWVNHPVCRWIVGVLLFILAATIAFPVIGFDPLHAMSIFTISLGQAEKDGLAVILGVMVGVLSLALIAVSALNVRALRAKVMTWLQRVTRRMGFGALANYCERKGWPRLAGVLRFQLPDLLVAWDPERRETERRERAAKAKAAATGERRNVAATRSRAAAGDNQASSGRTRAKRSIAV